MSLELLNSMLPLLNIIFAIGIIPLVKNLNTLNSNLEKLCYRLDFLEKDMKERHDRLEHDVKDRHDRLEQDVKKLGDTVDRHINAHKE